MSESLSRHPSNHPTDPSSKNLIVTLNAENEISIKSETCYEKYHHEKKIKKENEIPKSNQNDCATFTKNVFKHSDFFLEASKVRRKTIFKQKNSLLIILNLIL